MRNLAARRARLLVLLAAAGAAACQWMDPEGARVREVLQGRLPAAKQCGAEVKALVDRTMALPKDAPMAKIEEIVRDSAGAGDRQRACLARLKEELGPELKKTNVSEAKIDEVWTKWTKEIEKRR